MRKITIDDHSPVDSTDGTCRCLFCLHTFSGRSMSLLDRVKRRSLLIEFCKQFVNNPQSMAPEDINFFARLEEIVMKRQDISLCVECLSDVAMVVKARQEQGNNQVLQHHYGQQLFRINQMYQNQQYAVRQGMEKISEKIKMTNCSDTARTVVATLANYKIGKQLAEMRERVVEVASRDLSEQYQRQLVPAQTILVNPLADVAVGYGPVLSGCIEAPGVSMYNDSHLFPSLPALLASGEKSLKRPHSDSSETTAKNGMEKAFEDGINLLAPKKTKGMLGEEPSPFKKWMLDRASKPQGDQKTPKEASNGDPIELPVLRYCQVTDKFIVGSVEVRINEETQSLECTECKYVANPPKQYTSTTTSTGKKPKKKKNPYLEVEKKMTQHIRQQHLDMFKNRCKFCKKGFQTISNLQAHEKKCEAQLKATEEPSDVTTPTGRVIQEMTGEQMDQEMREDVLNRSINEPVEPLSEGWKVDNVDAKPTFEKSTDNENDDVHMLSQNSSTATIKTEGENVEDWCTDE